MNAPKISFFYPTVVNPGGAERLLIEEMKYFDTKGADTSLITFDFKKDALFNYDTNNIHTISSKKSILRIIGLIKTLRNIKPDLIIVHQYNIFIYLATLFVRIPYVSHIHGTFFWSENNLETYSIMHRSVYDKMTNCICGHKEFLNKRNFGILERLNIERKALFDYFAMRKSKILFTLTEQVKNEIKLLYNKNAIVVRAGIDPSLLWYKPTQVNEIKKKWGISTDTKIILSISRIDPRKRLDLLIRSFAELYKNTSDVVLILVGGGDDTSLINLANELAVDKHIIFAGYVPENQINEYYAMCDVFAFPGWCAYGLTAIEAIAFDKKIVLSTDTMVNEVLLNCPNALISEPSIATFAKSLEVALNSKEQESKNFIIENNLTWMHYFEGIYKYCLNILN